MPILVPVVVATPFVFAAWVIHRVLLHRMEVQRLEAGNVPRPMLPPASIPPDVEQRLANLEAIACSEDRDFERRLRERGAA